MRLAVPVAAGGWMSSQAAFAAVLQLMPSSLHSPRSSLLLQEVARAMGCGQQS